VPLFGGPDFWFVQDNAAALTLDNVVAFHAGNMYFNIHNEASPGRAIRGQIDMTATAVEFASLDNTQETEGSDSTGKGGGLLAVEEATGRLGGFLVHNVADATRAHIHQGARGVPATSSSTWRRSTCPAPPCTPFRTTSSSRTPQRT
jgi:hypothetical protein